MNKIESRHSLMVSNLVKPGEDIQAEMTPQKWALLMEACRKFMEAAQYLEQAKKLAFYNKGSEIVPRSGIQVPNISPDMFHLLHMAIGIAGESGETMETWFDALRNDQFNKESVLEELGDLEFYLQGFRKGLPVHRNMTLEHNLRKLGKRYKDGYSDQAAKDRADKLEESIPDLKQIHEFIWSKKS